MIMLMKMYIYIYIYIYTQPLHINKLWWKVIFEWSLTDLKLEFSFFEQRLCYPFPMIREAWSDQLTVYVKPYYLHNCPDCILQIALLANKYLILFYLKGACRWWLMFNCTERAILKTIPTKCKQKIHIK